jgi:hypothetical protein
MLLFLAILLLLIFGGLGFLFHLLWIGLIVALIVFVIHAFTGRRHTTTI